MKRICKVNGCDRTDIKGRGMCHKHYQRWKRNGTPDLKIAYKGPRKYFPKEYRIWEGINERCYQQGSTSYPHYGARGISVCDRWRGPYGFENFIKDMGGRPSPRHSIDRIDVNGNYEPDNCRWATPIEQACNRRNNAPVPGVHYDKQNKKWRARYRANGYNLSKMFNSKEEAVDQRIEWLQKYPQY